LIKDLDGTRTSLQQYLDTEIDLDKSPKSFKLLEANTDASLSNQPAYLIVDTFTGESGSQYKEREVGTIIGDKAYVVKYFVVADNYSYLPTVDKMIDSYTIFKNQ
jgi:hypothetical protein